MAPLRALVLAACGALAAGRARQEHGLRAGSGLAAHREELRNEMRRLMDEEDDGDLTLLVHPESGGSARAAPSTDPYVKEAEDALEAVLGPRWSREKLDRDADQSTKALLQTMGGHKKTVQHLRSLMGGLGA
mmetsp:Transcript_29603/g.77548  ORF Transcript_29603/g.77548 Transcript_29603/m.77548 type:complete len:132 (-) Transcript_29603:81-476(-)